MFMYYHQADYLTTSLLHNDFKIVHISRKTTSMTDGSTVTDLVIIASKNA